MVFISWDSAQSQIPLMSRKCLHFQLVKRMFYYCCRSLEGKSDFDLIKPPPADMLGGFSASVHPVGDQWERDQEDEIRREKEAWKKKVIVEDINFHTHRCVRREGGRDGGREREGEGGREGRIGGEKI